MEQIKFIKDHPSNRFKKGDLVDMPKENVDAWVKSGYAVLPNDIGDELGNVETSTKVGEESKKNSQNGLESGKENASESTKLSKNKKKKRGNKNR